VVCVVVCDGRVEGRQGHPMYLSVRDYRLG